jgi:cation-transporting ATPase E
LADASTVSGPELEELDADELDRTARETSIFGRVGPHQKEQIISVLRKQGYYVAMLGDGVNDVPALKRADLAIALQAGSQAARAVADLVLLDDSFGVLPAVVREGQRIVRGLLDVLRLFLVRVFYTAMLIVFVGLIQAGFPLGPRHNALVALLTVGIPTLALAAWAKPGPIATGGMLRWLVHFVAPAAWSLALIGFVVYLWYFVSVRAAASHLPLGPEQVIALAVGRNVAQTMITGLSIFCGLLLVVFAEPPSPAWVGGAPLGGERWPTLLAGGLMLGFLLILVSPPLRAVFDLAPLSPADLALIGVLGIGWAAVLRWSWRKRLLERMLNIDNDGTSIKP